MVKYTLLSVLVAALYPSTSADEDKLISDQIDWLRAKGGTFNDKLEIRHADQSDPTSRYGMYATGDIPEDELLIEVPRSCLLTAGDDTGSYGGMWCPTVRNLIKEMRKGDESDFAPYAKYLKVQPHGQLPSAWSDAGKELLLEVLGQNDEDPSNDLRPAEPIDWIDSDWYQECKGGDDPFEQNAGLMLVQRGWDDIMIPVYDMMSHRNGKWLNTKSNSVHEKTENVRVSASQDIKAGDEIYTTYNFCEDCGNRGTKHFGTPEIFRDYGFVENYPQRWFLGRKGASFELDEEFDEDGTPTGAIKLTWLEKKRPKKKTTGYMLKQLERLNNVASYELENADGFGFVENYPQRWFLGRKGASFELDEEFDEEGTPTGAIKLTWLAKNKPAGRSIGYMLKQFERLNNVASYELENADESIPKNELASIKEYHKAATAAITHALNELDVDIDEHVEGCEGDTCAVTSRYDDLGFREDDLDYAVYTCDTSVSMSMDHFDKIDGVKSHYQSIDFVKDPKNDNVCFDISNIIQMCGSYRPHYHEMVVHYTARFVKDVKRVIWVGGGDSMLLHEIVKYPGLEFVVGLEIDQWVTRLSFKHTGTQPHYDNDKVQWWYGDAAKSLLMLPKEYFGTFDMVLVDLSETVTSALVTDGLDIMQALALLLKPEGIFVKNELYMEQMADIFDYSIQIHYDGVPVICSQCLILGSNKVDFLFDELTDHDLNAPNLYIQPLDKIEDTHEYFHDYRRNSTSQHYCDHDGDLEAVPDVQKRSPGILMIVEVEDVTVDLEDVAGLTTLLSSTLKSEGLSVLSTETSKTDQGASVIIYLGEGYVVARTFPEQKYCAVDIHFWSSFDKHEGAKKSLIKAFGSKDNRSSSSYRIVAGGMFGVSTWKEDTKKRGPRVTDKCHREPGKEREKALDIGIADTILEKSMDVIPSKEITAVLLCGDSASDCSSLKILEQSESVGKIITLTSCPDISNEFEEGALLKMRACEKQVYNTLTESLQKEKIRAVVIDPRATQSFTRIAYKVLKAKKSRFFSHDFTGVAVMLNEEESWRRNLMERFRKDIILWDFNFRAEVLFNSTDTTLEMDVISSGDEGFVKRLLAVTADIEKETSLVSDVRDIKGGLFYEDPEWEWSHFFLPEDYDQRGPLEQWKSQQPVGHQSVMQLEPKNPNKKIDFSMDAIKSALKMALSSMESDESKAMSSADIKEVDSVGDGGLVTALWSGGNCVALWNGRDHIDLNLFTFVESKELHDEFVLHFRTYFRMKLAIALRDTQPRGYGRVVNFPSDIGDRSDPHWAKFKE
eukprot:CAMPEP_0194261054 /NCGR_PEP_ID=MMETSP0158-20130606/45824_1 /TAXON_ID=33649 /ORGANISM="Thalassionema nitzschioides, Strain L26-B" /LENGTH=1291 /DNA_ID=CAMNT_0039001161 /DNA_START=88 /DNA_END=3964 /DNA_ORIENTATION=-